MNKKHKNNIVGAFFTILVIGLLILSGPAQAINVDLETLDINYLEDDTVPFTIIVQINDDEFLPLLYTDLILDYGADDGDPLTCKLNNDNTIDNCDFLTVTSAIKDLQGSYGYGYGYGYGYSNGNYGYGYDSGYGYGYGYSGANNGYGTITYNLIVDVSKIPLKFLDKNINVEARVYGGNEDNWRYFKGTSSFFVDSSYDPANVPREGGVSIPNTIDYGNVMIQYGLGAIPAGVNSITVKQVLPKADPSNFNFKIMGKVYDFTTDGLTNFNGDLTITFIYTDKELGDYNENRIAPAFYNEATGEWEILTVISRDTDNNKISFLTNHFTQFALLVDITPATPPTPVTSGGGGPSGRRATDDIIPTPTPVVPEVVPTEEVPAVTAPTPEGITQPTGFAAITGAVVGALGTGGAIVVLILVIGGVGTGGYFLVRKKRK